MIQAQASQSDLHYCILALIGLLTTALGWILGRSRAGTNGKGDK